MSGQVYRTNPILFWLCMILCVGSGWFLTESTSSPYLSDGGSETDIVLADKVDGGNLTEAEATQSEETIADTEGEMHLDNPASTDPDSQPETEAAESALGEETVPETDAVPAEPEEKNDEDAENNASDQQALSADPQKTTEAMPSGSETGQSVVEANVVPGDFHLQQTSAYEVSPEASQGTWISSGNGWVFFVDGAAYTGWLNDLDGKRYYLRSDGLMATGWLEQDGAVYYLDQDGIMQTGERTLEGETYVFDASGVMDAEKSSVPPLPEPAVEENTEQPTQESAEQPSQGGAEEPQQEGTEQPSQGEAEQSAQEGVAEQASQV